MWAELEAEDQTPLVNIRRSPGRFEAPPPLPIMDKPAVYILHPDVMQINTRKNNVRDRMRASSDIRFRIRGNKTHDDGRTIQQ